MMTQQTAGSDNQVLFAAGSPQSDGVEGANAVCSDGY